MDFLSRTTANQGSERWGGPRDTLFHTEGSHENGALNCTYVENSDVAAEEQTKGSGRGIKPSSRWCRRDQDIDFIVSRG